VLVAAVVGRLIPRHIPAQERLAVLVAAAHRLHPVRAPVAQETRRASVRHKEIMAVLGQLLAAPQMVAVVAARLLLVPMEH